MTVAYEVFDFSKTDVSHCPLACIKLNLRDTWVSPLLRLPPNITQARVWVPPSVGAISYKPAYLRILHTSVQAAFLSLVLFLKARKESWGT